MLKTLNLKDIASIDGSIAIMQMEIENAQREGVTVLKLIHGYGSHGKGGSTLKEVRRILSFMKKQGKVKNFFNGDKWNLFEEEAIDILNKDKTIVNDCDLNRKNPGITIVVI